MAHKLKKIYLIFVFLSLSGAKGQLLTLIQQPPPGTSRRTEGIQRGWHMRLNVTVVDIPSKKNHPDKGVGAIRFAHIEHTSIFN